jgi:hypothetical protein
MLPLKTRGGIARQVTGSMTSCALSRLVQCIEQIHIVVELSTAYECVFYFYVFINGTRDVSRGGL